MPLVNTSVFFVTTPYSLLEIYRRFEGTGCLRIQVRAVSTIPQWRHKKKRLFLKVTTEGKLILYEPCIILQYYICSPARYITFVMVEYLFTVCLTARHISDRSIYNLCAAGLVCEDCVLLGVSIR